MLALAPLLLALAVAGPARADDAHYDPHVRDAVGARAAFLKPDDSSSARWGGGAQLRLHLDSSYVFEASLDATRHRAGQTDFREYPLQFSLLGFALRPDSALSFYGVLGYGWYLRKVLGPAAHTEVLSHPHVGLGAQLLVGEHWSIDGDYRFLWSSVWRWDDYTRPFGSAYQYRGQMFTLALNRFF